MTDLSELVAALERKAAAQAEQIERLEDRLRAVEWERDMLLAEKDPEEAARIALLHEQPDVGLTYSDLGRRGGSANAAFFARVDDALTAQGLFSGPAYMRAVGISKATLARWRRAKVVTGEPQVVEGREIDAFTEADVELGRALREVQAEPRRMTLQDAAAEARRRLSASA